MSAQAVGPPGAPAVARRALQPGGALEAALPGFRSRSAQQTLAAEVAATLDGGGVLIAEAGTGTGKTLAYAVPALQRAARGGRILISTGTRALQEQLHGRDLPRCRDALGLPVRIALLKGRNNYLCQYRTDRYLEGNRFETAAEARAVEEARAWSGVCADGDLESAPASVRRVSDRVTATPEQCLASQCPFHETCFFYRARDEAAAADVVVVNHHLLLADWAVKDAGHGAVLPNADALILDEAHQLPEIAGRFFGHRLTSRDLRGLLRDARRVIGRDAADTPVLAGCLDGLEGALEPAARALSTHAPPAGERRTWEPSPGVLDAFTELSACLETVAGALEAVAPGSEELAALARRARARSDEAYLFVEPAPAEAVQWYEAHPAGFALHATPLDVGRAFRRRLESEGSAQVLTSATLSVQGSFEGVRRRLGLSGGGARELLLPSPFDYQTRSRLYVPRGLPLPQDPGYDDAVLDAGLQALDGAPGGAFFLFTSHRALQRARDRLRGTLERPLLVQGEAGHGALLARFMEAGDAVLLGTASFWEGVDVVGPALSLVVIDRLPFASPADPVLAARLDAIQRNGGSPFVERLVPDAVLALKQGAGRLIRDEDDRGVLMVGDPRLVERGYGRAFLESLPPMPLTRSLEAVRAFQCASRS